MGARRNRQKSANLRLMVAEEAARIIVEHGVRDDLQAKSKAAEKLGVTGRFAMPRNTEIENALRERQALFEGHHHHQRLERLREAALRAMDFFQEFDPRLVGPVLDGTADDHSAVCLHLFADTPEMVALYLHQNRVPFDESARTIRTSRSQSQTFPVFVFEAGGVAMDIMVLPEEVRRQAPLSPVDGRPMQRASAREVAAMLEEPVGIA